jgi:MFS family permease
VTSAFVLAQTAVTPLYGKLGDLYGRKRILQSAIDLFLAGSALCGQAHHAERLLDARRELLREALADETAHRNPEVTALLQRLARELCGEPPTAHAPTAVAA